jgi:uncharacterized protein YeaO (DUF488 family)
LRGMRILLKRAYDPAAEADGERYLVERLWPRGVSKERAQLAGWLRDLAPSPELRKWYGHQRELWPEFRQRYLAELAGPDKLPLLAQLRQAARQGTVTLVLAASDPEHSSALVLKEYLEGKA